jgi:Na+/H+ antiporter NhaD/arsenite permease-like protein
MFAGPFIIVAGTERALLSPDVTAYVGRLKLHEIPVLSAATAILSNLVSNVPAVLVMKPFVDPLPDHDKAWLVVAMASTLASHLTVLGSIANLIVLESRPRRCDHQLLGLFQSRRPADAPYPRGGTFWLIAR